MYLTLFGTLPWCLLHNYDVQALSTLNRITLTPARKLYRIWLLFKHINGFSGPVSVMGRSCAPPILNMCRHLSDWCLCRSSLQCEQMFPCRQILHCKTLSQSVFLVQVKNARADKRNIWSEGENGDKCEARALCTLKKFILSIECKKNAWPFCSLNEALPCSNSVRTYEWFIYSVPAA